MFDFLSNNETQEKKQREGKKTDTTFLWSFWNVGGLFLDAVVDDYLCMKYAEEKVQSAKDASYERYWIFYMMHRVCVSERDTVCVCERERERE